MVLFQSTQNNIVQKPVKLHPENSRFSIICSLSLYKFNMLPQAFIISLVGAYHTVFILLFFHTKAVKHGL